MRPEIRRLLTEIVPSAVGCQIEVTRAIMESGDEERITTYIKSRLTNSLAKFIADNIVLDGSDAFRMEFDYSRQSTVCRAQVHVLTPQQLRDVLQKAYDAGFSDAASKFKYTAHNYPYPKNFPT